MITKAPKCIVLESWLDSKYLCMNYDNPACALRIDIITYAVPGLKHQHSTVLGIVLTIHTA